MILRNCFITVQIVFLIGLFNSLIAQKELTLMEEARYIHLLGVDSIQNGYYNDLTEAILNPDSVYHLDLSGYGLKYFPEVILSFKNLVILDLGYTCQSVDTLSDSLVRAYIHTMAFREGKFAVKFCRRNYLESIPCEISELKHLKYLDIRGLPVNRWRVRKLRKCFRGRYIWTDQEWGFEYDEKR